MLVHRSLRQKCSILSAIQSWKMSWVARIEDANLKLGRMLVEGVCCYAVMLWEYTIRVTGKHRIKCGLMEKMSCALHSLGNSWRCPGADHMQAWRRHIQPHLSLAISTSGCKHLAKSECWKRDLAARELLFLDEVVARMISHVWWCLDVK